jgi:hypothetical protein
MKAAAVPQATRAGKAAGQRGVRQDGEQYPPRGATPLTR